MLAVVAALCGFAATVPPEDDEAMLRLVVNDKERGDVVVIFAGDVVWVPRAELLAAGVPESALTRVIAGAPTADRAWVTLASLAPAVSGVVDRDQLVLALSVAPSLRPRSVIDRGAAPPPNLERRSDASLFLNYAPSIDESLRAQGTFEAGGSIDTFAASTTLTVTPERGFVRGLSTASYDFPDAMVRVAAGDVIATSGPLGGGVLLGGASVTRSFELNPYFTAAPTFAHAGTALTPSHLDVYVNGARVSTTDVPAGPYDLEHVPLGAGSGDVKLVLRDAFGNEQVLQSPYYGSASVLDRGVQDFQYAIGFVRRDFGATSFDYGAPAFVAHHRFGVERWLTLGGGLEATPDVVNGGPSAVVVTPVGQLDVAVAASLAATGTRVAPTTHGAAGLVGFTYVSRAFAVGVRGRATSADYADVSLAPSADRKLLDAAVFAALPVFSFLSTSARLEGSVDRNDGARHAQLDVGLSTQIASFVSLSLTVTQGLLPRDVPLSAFATVSATLDGHNASVGAFGGPDHVVGIVDASRPLPPGPGLGYRAHVEAAPDHVAGEATAQGQLTVGRAEVTAGFVGEQLHGSVDVAGSLVYVAGAGFFLSRPLRGPFAVLRVPGAPGVRGLLNNQDVGRTDGDGDLLVPDLLPYYGNRLTIADEDLPPDFVVEGGERIVAPTQHGAALVAITAHRVRYLRARVVLGARGGAPAAYGALHLEGRSADDVVPLGDDGTLELEGLAAGSYRARVDYQGGACTIAFTMPADGESSDAVVDVGEVACVP